MRRRILAAGAVIVALGTGCVGGGGKGAAPSEGFNERTVSAGAGLDTEIDVAGVCVKAYRVGRDGRAGSAQHYSVTIQLDVRPEDDADLGRVLARPACEREMRTLQQRIVKAHAIPAPFGSYVTMWFKSSGNRRLLEP